MVGSGFFPEVILKEGISRGVWLTEAGGEREARLRFLAERGLRLLMADVDPVGRESLHFFDPREGKTLHLLSREGGGLVEKASSFFPSAARWLELLYGAVGCEGSIRRASREGGPGVGKSRGEREEPARSCLPYAGGELLVETAGGRVLRVIECLRMAPSLRLRGGKAGSETERAREALGGDLPLLLSFLLALEEGRGCAVPPSARAVRAVLLELLRMRYHCSWLCAAAALSGRFRLSRRLKRWGEGIAELERTVTGGRGIAEALVPGGVRNGVAERVVRELWKDMEDMGRQWAGLYRRLAALSPPRWAERRLARLPREGRSGERGTGTAACGGPWKGWEAWVGPLARALGSGSDARAEDPAFSMPPGWSPRVTAGKKGTLRRMVEVRAGEVGDSLAIIEALLQHPLEGPWEAPRGRHGSGRGFGRCEGPEGETCCHLVLERGRVVHAAFSSPRELNRNAASCLEGAWLDEAAELLPLLHPD